MIANYHTHTWRCNHASGKEEEYVNAARKRGLETLGFSDHSPYFFPGTYYSHFRMRPHQLKDYCDTVLKLRETYKDRIDIRLGLETEYYPALFSELMAFLRNSPVEYIILGQHFLGNEIGDAYNGSPTGDDDALKRYCAQTMDAMQTGLYTYFAHPDLICYRGSKRLYTEQMRRLCQEAASCGLPLEINLHGLRERRNYPSKLFWQLAAEEGCTAILGCDAHEVWHMEETKTEETARKMAKQLGITLLDRVELKKI